MGTQKLRAEISLIIKEIEFLIQEQGDYFTEGSKLAIGDVVIEAKKALDNQYKHPFIRNREFYKPRQDEELLFALERYTMVGSYDREDVFSYYGLKPAYEWFKKENMSEKSLEELQEKKVLFIEQAEEFIASSKVGKDMGCVDEKKLLALKEAITTVKESQDKTKEILAKAIVKGYNALRELRHSKILKTDIDQEAYLYFTKEEFEELQQTIMKDTLVHNQYEKIKNIADGNSLEEINKLDLFLQSEMDYEKINQLFYVWGGTGKTVNFTTPKETVKATLAFSLPSEENELDGLGHVWLDNVRILNSSGQDPVIRNAGFEEGDKKPESWRKIIKRGKPILCWENKYPYCGSEQHSLYFENATGGDEGAWEYEEEIILQEETTYTLDFLAKVDGKLKKGLKAVIHFMDQEGKVIDDFIYYFNKKSGIGGGTYGLSMQCDAIMYALTQEEDYALKAKKEMQFFLNDFCQGIENWLVTNLRPDGSDAYGAVQGGRMLCSLASTYTFIKKAKVFNKEEKELFYRQIEYFLRYLLDLRDRTELSEKDAQRQCSNWQTDMCAGTGMLMMVLDDFPNRKTWLYNANKVLKAQLEININPDSSWPESIRYHQVAVARFAGYAKVLKNITGEDWFVSTPLSKMFGYALNVQTPTYCFFDNRISTPPFGDHILSNGNEFGVYGIYASDIEKINKTLADQMVYTWQKAGSPTGNYSSEAIALENLFVTGRNYKLSEGFKLELKSTGEFKNAGVYIFRKNFEKENESYFAIMSSPKRVAHGHLDQGSFIIYKNGTPIVMDSGVEGYFDGSVNWHLSAYSHACVQFATGQSKIEKVHTQAINLTAGTYSIERGWVDVPYMSEVIDFSIGGSIETITIAIDNPEGKGKHIRKVVYIPKSEVYIIRDEIQDFEGKVQFSLPVVSNSSVIEGNKVYSIGYFDVDLETIFLGVHPQIRIEKGRSAQMFPSENGVCMMDYIRATTDGANGFVTVIYPKTKEEESIYIEEREKAYTIRGKGGEQIKIDKREFLVTVEKIKDLI